MSDGQILFARKDDQCFIRMVGEVRHPSSPGFDAMLQKLFAEQSSGNFIIDLTQAVYLDSTNLGLLAKIYQHARSVGGATPVIVCSDKKVNRALSSIGFDKLFAIVQEKALDEAEFQPAPDIDASDRDRAELILSAHRALAEMNEQCHDMFCDVVKMFEQSMPSGEKPS
jgi:anti-anti-sigma factor